MPKKKLTWRALKRFLIAKENQTNLQKVTKWRGYKETSEESGNHIHTLKGIQCNNTQPWSSVGSVEGDRCASSVPGASGDFLWIIVKRLVVPSPLMR